jgi:hypothetical protein
VQDLDGLIGYLVEKVSAAHIKYISDMKRLNWGIYVFTAMAKAKSSEPIKIVRNT